MRRMVRRFGERIGHVLVSHADGLDVEAVLVRKSGDGAAAGSNRGFSPAVYKNKRTMSKHVQGIILYLGTMFAAMILLLAAWILFGS
jgi:hypothetical protein